MTDNRPIFRQAPTANRERHAKAPGDETGGSISRRSRGTFAPCGGSAHMAPLMRFLLVNFAGGFALGLGTGFVFVILYSGLDFLANEPLAAAMMMWGFAATFAVGAVGTGLALLPYE